MRDLRQTKFWKHARAVCNFHLYYIRMRSFSVNQKRVSSTWTWLSPEYLVHFLFSLVFNYYVSISGSFRFRCYSIITSVSYTLSSICYRIITSVFCTFLVFHPDCDASISGTFSSLWGPICTIVLSTLLVSPNDTVVSRTLWGLPNNQQLYKYLEYFYLSLVSNCFINVSCTFSFPCYPIIESIITLVFCIL